MPPFFPSLAGGNSRGWRGGGHQADEELLEFGQVEVELGVDFLDSGLGAEVVGPGEGVAVVGAVGDVDVHVDEFSRAMMEGSSQAAAAISSHM